MSQCPSSRTCGSSVGERLVSGKRVLSAAGTLSAATIGTSSAASVVNQRWKSLFQRLVSTITGR